MNTYYQRKRMRLEGYDYSCGNICYLTICVQDREKILGKICSPVSDADRPTVILSEIGKIVDTYTKTIHGIDKYIIMPNHVHMIVFNEPGENVGTKIRSWKTLITKAIGKSIWQREFYDHVIRDEQDYQIRWAYIEKNPDKWNLDRYYQK